MSNFCKICNYFTEDYSNFLRHKSTMKHRLNCNSDDKNDCAHANSMLTLAVDANCKTTSADISCKICNKKFNHKSSLSRHSKKCTNKIERENEKVTNKTDTEMELTIKCKYLEKEKELYKSLEKEKSDMLNMFMNNANTLLNKSHDNNKITAEAMKSVSISALRFANEKYAEAPILKAIENFNINNLSFEVEKDRKSLTELLIYCAKLKSLDKLLGDHIIKVYKKENPTEQSIHTTDRSRLNYIVKELITYANNGESAWEIDKNGIKICSRIIKPLIDKCIELLLEHQKFLFKKMENGDFSNRDDIMTIMELISTIDRGNLENDINKFIAPHFNLNKGS